MTPDLFSVQGRTAVVTGGSRGIGLMIARGLVQAGARVAISSRKADACAAAAEELGRDGEAVAIPADLSTREGVGALAAAVGERFGGGLDILVNNAGATWGAPLETFPDGAWDKVMATNVRGPFQLGVALLPALRRRAAPGSPARIINVGSIAGFSAPADENYAYSASKAAVHMLTRHLARRLARESITVNAIAPGAFHTKMTAYLLDDDLARASLLEQIPLGRIGDQDDVVGLTLLLASRAGAYITGAVIPLDGGLTGCS